MIIHMLQQIFRPMFGEFEREEFKKFLRLGFIFALIIGSYWTLRVMKDSVFMSLVGKAYIPWAKTASLILLFPLVTIYGRLMDTLSRERMFYLLSYCYAAGSAIIGLALYYFQGLPAADLVGSIGIAAKVFGYFTYVFVESYGSLVVALFWAFASDITAPESAKKGFYLTTALGQLGGIFGPLFVTAVPSVLKNHQLISIDTFAPSFWVVAGMVALVAIMVARFLAATPAHLLQTYHGKNEKEEEKEQEPGFLEGLKLLISHRYLLAIFFAIASYEIIVTIFDFNFKYLAATAYSGKELNEYLGRYGSMVNTVSLLCLLLGVSNITRWLGVGVALALMPLIVGGAVTGFLQFNNLDFLFWLMVGSKAINYALNGPAMKQLYIPTTHDVRFKSQAWIETFGSRGSKEAGSIINMLRDAQWFLYLFGKSAYIVLCGVLGYALVGSWFLVALYLGNTYKKAIEEKRVVC